MKRLLLLFTIILSAGMGFSQTQNTLDFDGTNDVVNIGYQDFSTMTEFTVEAWFRTTNTTASQRIASKDQQGTLGNFIFWYNSSQSWEFMAFDDVAGLWQRATYNSTAENDGYWHHIAGVINQTDNKIYLYMDGILQASDDFTAPFMDDSDNEELVIGADSDLDNGVTFVFDGTIDEVRIWDTALTQSQIRDNMYHEIPNPTAEPNLYAYFQFNETSGTNLPDLSGNGLNGTLTNMDPSTDWVSSTAPIPYYTVSDGFWFTPTVWAVGQGAPVVTSTWVRVEINNNISIPFGGATIEQATINPPGTITMTGASNFINVNGDLLIRSDATGTGSVIYPTGTVAYGSATVERYYTGGEWHFISPPISDAVSGMFTGLYLQYLDEGMVAPNEYVDIVGTNVPLNAMQGYALWNDNTATTSFTGTLNEGVQNMPLALTNLGWNLVGNPYPSSIDWDAVAGWSKTNVNNATYVHVNSGTWASYVGGVGTNGGTKFIAPGQGFLVECNLNPGALGMSDLVRVHNPTTFFKEAISNLVRLEVSGNGYNDETVIRFTDEASTTFDGDFDARKIFGGTPEAAQIYSFGDSPLSINSLPQTEMVALGLKTGINGSYSISATEINDLPAVYLTDQETGITTDLTTDSYTFQAQFGDIQDRFVIHFAPLAIDNNKLSASSIYSSANTIFVNIDGKGIYNVYSITGQIVKEGSVSDGMNTITVDKAGNYIVQVITNEGSMTKKVVLK